jgi:hypothetical protein
MLWKAGNWDTDILRFNHVARVGEKNQTFSGYSRKGVLCTRVWNKNINCCTEKVDTGDTLDVGRRKSLKQSIFQDHQLNRILLKFSECSGICFQGDRETFYWTNWHYSSNVWRERCQICKNYRQCNIYIYTLMACQYRCLWSQVLSMTVWNVRHPEAIWNAKNMYSHWCEVWCWQVAAICMHLRGITRIIPDSPRNSNRTSIFVEAFVSLNLRNVCFLFS